MATVTVNCRKSSKLNEIVVVYETDEDSLTKDDIKVSQDKDGVMKMTTKEESHSSKPIPYTVTVTDKKVEGHCAVVTLQADPKLKQDINLSQYFT